MEIQFVGAAGTVTGSKHLLRTQHATVLLDCGLYQGRRREAFEINRTLGFDASEVDAVVLSHAHIDHSGALPMMPRAGFRGPVFATPATRDLCVAMLTDAANIQAADARHIQRLIDRESLDIDPVEALYNLDDVVAIIERMISVPYHQRLFVAPGIHLTFHDAGHVLGSAITCLEVEEGARRHKLVFTGDLGRRKIPILRDPEYVDGATLLVTESTYGDRTHPPIEEMNGLLAKVVKETVERGGKLIVPSFALERAQEIVLAFRTLKKQGLIPNVPVYVDSPLTTRITDVFRLHPECYDAEARALIQGNESPFEFEGLRYVQSIEDSKAISTSDRPSVVIAASGMCEAGRVLHHLRAAIEDARNTICIVGFQAQHTLGRRLVERRPTVRIFGVERERRAQVVVLNGFSAHADQTDLIDYATTVRDRGAVERVMLVHGEPGPQAALRDLLRGNGFEHVDVPRMGDRLTL